MLLTALTLFCACSNENEAVIENENSLSAPEDTDKTDGINEDSSSEQGEGESEEPKEKLDLSSVSGEAVNFFDIWPEEEPATEYSFENIEYAEKWKDMLFSPDIVLIKAADGHNELQSGQLSAENVSLIFAFLESLSPKNFSPDSELNPSTGGAVAFGAFEENGSELWKVTYNGNWLVIHINGEEKGYIFDVEGQRTAKSPFDFLFPAPPIEPQVSEPVDTENQAFEKLRDIYYTDPLKISFDLGSYPGDTDIERFTPIYRTVYDYSDGAGYQMFKTDIMNGKTFLELTAPTDTYYVAYGENGTESSAMVTLEDGKYRLGMLFSDDNCKHFAMPETQELISLAGKLDLSKTICRRVQFIGYADGILINDGANEYFYVIGTTGESADDFSEGELLSAAELAEKMFG